MFELRDAAALRNAMNLIFGSFRIKGKLTDHALERMTERSETFDVNDITFSLNGFKAQEQERISAVLASNEVWRGVIKDHRNRMNIVFDLNGRFPGFFTVVTIIRMNPNQFKSDELWRESEWVHLRT